MSGSTTDIAIASSSSSAAGKADSNDAAERFNRSGEFDVPFDRYAKINYPGDFAP